MRRSPARWLLLAWALLGALAPFLAGERPLVARAAGAWYWPVIDGSRPPNGAPDWKTWWVGLPAAAPADAAPAAFAVMPPWPYGPTEVLPRQVGDAPSWAHPLGVDDAGRDQLSRLLHGARTALVVGAGSVVLAALLGITLGAFGGLLGGFADVLVLRLVEVFTCFPALLALLAANAFLGSGLGTVVVVLALVQWPAFARIVRGEMLSLRERPYVQAARGFGEPVLAVVWRDLLPELRGPLGVTAAVLAAEAILAESTLTFLGLGLDLRAVSWGAMLDQGRAQAYAGAWHLWLVPAVAIASAVVTLHAAADAADRR